MQQGYAGLSGVVESVSIKDVIEDALKINATAFGRHGIQLIREYVPVPPMVLEKHKLLQILVNFLSNAKKAMKESERDDKRLTLRIIKSEGGRVRIQVVDNGVGISKENLTRIFSHGFTTRKDGHGCGLHSIALAAKEIGRSLSVHRA